MALHLTKGSRSIDYALSQRFLLRRLTFISDGLDGEVELSVAATNPEEGSGRWVRIASQVIEPDRREQVIRFAAVDCRYVRLQITTRRPGSLSGLGAFGIRKAVEFYDPDDRGVTGDIEASAAVSELEDPVDIDEYAPAVSAASLDASPTNSLGWAHVEMVSSHEASDVSTTAYVLDEDSTTQFRFAKTDSSPTVVVDLGQSYDCGRVSVVYNRGEPGTMKMWLVDARPGLAASGVAPVSPGHIEIAGKVFRVRLKREASDPQGKGQVTFSEFQRAARYLVLQWERRKTESPGRFGLNEVALFKHGEIDERNAPRYPRRELLTEAVSDPVNERLKTSNPSNRLPKVPRVEIREIPVSR